LVSNDLRARGWKLTFQLTAWFWAVWHGIMRSTPHFYPARLNPTRSGKLAARPAKALTNSPDELLWVRCGAAERTALSYPIDKRCTASDI
jgi:hypothetical protein